MHQKVKGSAHCVQIIDPQDIGQPEEEPVVLPLESCDSSTDSDSSGNESLTPAPIRRRHQRPKRRTRRNNYWVEKRRRWAERKAEINAQIREQSKNGGRRDYIVMEYLQNGSIATLITKLANCKPPDENFRKIPNRVLWGFWLCCKC
jgi:hypothetical protein